jgi:parallel beta-helix repeat protein
MLLSANPLFADEYDLKFDEQTELKKDTTFSGTVYIKDNVSVPKGVTLTIKPGTVIKCENPGLCDDGNVNFSLSVEGTIIAIGTKDNPITFTSASKKEISSFGEIYLNESEGSAFENCTFQYSHWGLHIHDSKISIRNCTFKNTFGGIRFKGDLSAIGNQFINNDTSLRFWMGSPEITDNSFKDVGTAIFLREKVKGPVIRGNNFIGVKDYFIKLGEMQDADINIYDNNFGKADKKDLSNKLYDKEDDEYLGRIIIK